MRTKFTFLFALLFLGITSVNAQMASGSPAPDWTVTDLNGNTHTLSSVLASGKTVGLKWSATWCGPCWTYHNTHAMRDAYDMWGPSGTNQIEMYYMEASPSTNEACLYGPTGCVGGTQGDWVTGTPYNVVHLTGANQNLASQYQVPGYPTLYAVSPDMRVYYMGGWGSVSTNVWGEWLVQSFSLETNAVVVDAACGNGEIQLNTTGGYGNLNFSWDTGATTEDIDNLSPGTYTVTITDAHGYDIERSFTVTGPPAGPLRVDLVGVSDVSCFAAGDGEIEVSGAGGNGVSYTYAWSNGMTGEYITGLDGGTYDVTVTDNQLNCDVMEFFFVDEPIELLATSSTTPQTCGTPSGSIDIAATGGVWPYSYELDNGTSNTNGLFNNLAAGTYDVTVLDNNLCQKNYQITVDEEPEPVAMAASSNMITCVASQATVSGMGSTTGNNITYQWTTTNGNIVSGANSLEAIVDAGGDYMLEVTDAVYGCVEQAMTIVEADVQVPTIQVSDNVDLTCTQTSVQLCATVDPSTTVTWLLPSGPVNDLCVTVSAADTYVAEVAAANGCTSSASVVVGVSNDLPQVTIDQPATLTCASPSTTVMSTLQGDPADHTYAWTTSDGNIDGAVDGASITATAGGTYTLEVTNTSTGCTTTQNVAVDSEANLPAAAFSYTIDNGVVTFVNISTDGDDPQWTLGDGTTSTDGEVTHSFEANGSYEVCITVTNECGPSQDCITIEYAVALTATSEKTDVLCFGSADGTAAVVPEGGLEPYMVTWTGPNGEMLTGESIDGLSPGDYSYVLDDSFGYQQTGSVTVVEPEDIIVASADITNASAMGADDGAITIDVSGGSGDLSYQWSNGATTATITGLAAGEYSCVISDSNGCEKTTDSYTVEAGSVAVSDIEGLVALSVYPSPTRDYVHMSAQLVATTDVQVFMMNMQGQILDQRTITDNEVALRFDLSSQPAGLYLLKMQTADGSHTEKVIKLGN